MARVPVTVVTGFLGAGKTTLVNRWLAERPRGEIAIVVNEHGAVGIDGELLRDRVRVLVEITGGCVCCATQAELAQALDDIAAPAAAAPSSAFTPSPTAATALTPSSAPAPKRILIETSGAASPAGVLRVIGGREGLFLDGVVTVVDASRTDVLDEHDLAREQVGYADVIVASHADACSSAEREHVLASVSAHNGAAVVALSSPSEGDSLEALLARRHEDLRAPPPPPATSHSVYESIALVHDGELDGERLADFMETELERFAGRLLRSKGILALEGVADRMIVQGVADRVEVTFGAPWADAPRTSRFVIIGFGLDRQALERAFAACALPSRS